MSMEESKYKLLLAYTLVSLLFCLALPINAALNHVRQISDDYAWYVTKDEASTTYNDDAGIVVLITLPSLIVIFAAFIHYLMIPLNKPENHHPKILPIFYFKNGFFNIIGRMISYLCVYTMPWLIPIGIYVVYNTKRISDDPSEIFSNETFSAFVYLLPLTLAFGAWLFFNFYIIYFIKKIIIRKKKKKGTYVGETDGWFVY